MGLLRSARNDRKEARNDRKEARNDSPKIIIFLVLSIIIATKALALTGEDIAWKVYNRPQGKDSQAESIMILKKARGKEKVREMRIFTREDKKARYTLMRFLSPKDIAGTAFLSISYHNGKEKQFLYLPALKRTRRIAGSFKFHRFVNSEFLYEDLDRRYPPKYHHELLKEEIYNGTPCYVVKTKPKKKKYSSYGYWIQWVTKDGFLPIRIDIYDRKGKLFKRFTAQKWEKIQGYWTIFESKMENLKKKRETIIKIEKIVYDQGLAPEIFTKRRLERW
ncbi:hypothetical protein TH606_04855 [Thermodesulfatator autotrophicus]|uniref:Uncharacterized protein TP-0789 domain-containing protein n=2 Tax=Thermodesulfatator autotrophicus TaxID=1795632 RepID=A0A177E7J8_9BACT|nr:hypothetical protein TH606_04855 [Thermodesulfatator autotrophicus]